MAEKGRKPAAAAWGSAARHQGRGGTSRANLAVRTGAWKGELVGGGDGWWVKGRGRARRRPSPPPPSTHRLFLPTTPPDHRERQRDRAPDGRDGHNGARGQGLGGAVRGGDGVGDTERGPERHRRHARREQHVAHPVHAAHLPVIRTGDSPRDGRGRGVQADERGLDHAARDGRERAGGGQGEDGRRDGDELGAGADEGAKQVFGWGRTGVDARSVPPSRHSPTLPLHAPGGNRNTSPCTYFQPHSSSSSPAADA